ncbi:MAG: hypothetical protein M4D80_41870 [Myxococcota bacterium]|nr:hypothetical protein [Myxococcota bacterium]
MTLSQTLGVRALLVVLVGACTPSIYRAPVRQPNYYSINVDGSRSEKYSRVNQWSSYGTSGLGAQPKIAAAYEAAQHAAAPSVDVTVYNASLPTGVSLEHGVVKIATDAPYTAIGRFEIGYWAASAPREHELDEDLRRLAAVTHGDTIVVEVQRIGHADDRVQYMNGIVLRKTGTTTTATSRARAEARLVYKANGLGCLSADEFADEVSAKLGYSPWRESAQRTLHAELAHADGSYRAVISVAGAASKQLSATTCKALTDAVVTVLVVQLDDPMKR